MDLPYLSKLITKLAPKVRARVVLEPEWGYVGQIIYKNGVTRSIRHLSLDLNPIASSDIARDKGYAKFFLQERGYPVAGGFPVYSPKWAKAIESDKSINYALKESKKYKFPLVVKPNSKSQGTGVEVVYSNNELKMALLGIFKYDNVALVEDYLPGEDYRIVVLDNKIISAYTRVPLSVVGDGEKSVLRLLKDKNQLFINTGRDTRINFKDIRIKNKLKRIGYSWASVPSMGEKVFLLDNANLSTGGDSVDVTDTIHPSFKKLAIDITRNMGLRICGVDLMLTKGDIAENVTKTKYYVIEINSAPGLDHYVTTGKAQRKIVEDMYLKILKALGKKD